MASAVTGGEIPVPSVLIMGATCVDRVLSVAAYPRPDSKVRTTSNAEMCGGNAPVGPNLHVCPPRGIGGSGGAPRCLADESWR